MKNIIVILSLVATSMTARAGFFSNSETAIKGTCVSTDQKFTAKIKLKSVQGRQEWIGDFLDVRVVNKSTGEVIDVSYSNGFEEGVYAVEIDKSGQKFTYYGFTTLSRAFGAAEIRKVEFICDNKVNEKVLNYTGRNFGNKFLLVKDCTNCDASDAQ